jgi:hypothetical protein
VHVEAAAAAATIENGGNGELGTDQKASRNTLSTHILYIINLSQQQLQLVSISLSLSLSLSLFLCS